MVQTSPLSLSFDSAVTAGSSIVLAGTLIDATDQAAPVGTVVGRPATWAARRTRRAESAYLPNGDGRRRQRRAGTPSFSVPVTVGGVAATNSDLPACCWRSRRCPRRASSRQDGERHVVVGAIQHQQFSATGNAHADGQSVRAGGGRLVRRSDESERLHRQRPERAERHVYRLPRPTKKVTANTTQTGTVSHDTAPEASAILLVLKAADDAGYYYEFLLVDAAGAAIASGITNIKAIVARNHDPYTDDTKEYYPGLSSRRAKSSLPQACLAAVRLRHTLRILRVVGRVDRKRRLVARRSEGGLTMAVDYIAIIRDDNTLFQFKAVRRPEVLNGWGSRGSLRRRTLQPSADVVCAVGASDAGRDAGERPVVDGRRRSPGPTRGSGSGTVHRTRAFTPGISNHCGASTGNGSSAITTRHLRRRRTRSTGWSRTSPSCLRREFPAVSFGRRLVHPGYQPCGERRTHLTRISGATENGTRLGCVTSCRAGGMASCRASLRAVSRTIERRGRLREHEHPGGCSWDWYVSQVVVAARGGRERDVRRIFAAPGT